MVIDVTDPTEITRLFEAQKAFQPTLKALGADHRIARIRALRKALVDFRPAIKEAMWADFRKAPESVDKTDILPAAFEATYVARHVRRWMKPRRAHTPLFLFGTSSKVHVEPKGTALIMAPWNYPVNLTIGPLIAAVAAGCTAIVKPSEHVPATARVIRDLVASVFPPEEAVVVEGATDTATHLLSLPFDHIYFTGSPGVGRLVMKAAAEHLTSVTLELGGKSPTIVDETADIDHAASVLVFSKFTNCGQTCVAPDYVYVHAAVFDRLQEALIERIGRYYGPTAAEREERPEFGRLATVRHANRVRALAADAVAGGATLVHGSTDVGADERFLDATILTDVPADAAVLNEEIFGPVLPLVRFERLEEVLADIVRRPKPLALYIFSRRKDHIRRVIGATSAGATVVNDALIHFLNLDLPFGGVGESGMGKGKGHAGFLAFSNERGVLTQHLRPPLLSLLYAPYTKWTRRLLDLLLRLF